VTILDNILFDALPYGPLMLGIVLCYRYLRELDLTFAATFVLGPAVMVSVLSSGYSLLVGIVGAAFATVALSCLTLFLSLRIKIESLLAGLLSSFAGFSGTLLLTQGTVSLADTVNPLNVLITLDSQWFWHNIPLHPFEVALFLGIVLLLKAMCDHFLASEVGLAFRAMEDSRSSEQLLNSIGIAPEKMTAVGLIAGNLLCALSGVLVVFRDHQITAQRGFDVLLTAIAAYLLGNNLFEKRPMRSKPKTWIPRTLSALQKMKPTTSVIAGLIFYYSLLTVVSRFNIPSSIPKLIFVLLIVSSFSAIRLSEYRSLLELDSHNLTKTTSGLGELRVAHANVLYSSFPSPIQIINDASLVAKAGQVIQLAGENGTGKSTLLKFIAGWVPGKGEVIVPYNRDSEVKGRIVRRQLVVYIHQDASLTTSATLSTKEHLALFAIGRNVSAWRAWDSRYSRKWKNLTEEIGIVNESIPVGLLSGGQRQILSLASLEVREDCPQVLLLDEPLTYLDEANARRCVELISRFRSEGRIIVIVQHDMLPKQFYMNSEARTNMSDIIDHRVTLSDLQGSAR
jgi:ABC-type Mn2+/Zn2+ transport system ATPase subunit/ABC-type uncharacterized transport system permease subunit